MCNPRHAALYLFEGRHVLIRLQRIYIYEVSMLLYYHPWMFYNHFIATLYYFCDEEGGGGDEVEGFSFFSFNLRWRLELSILNSSFSVSCFIILLHNASMLLIRLQRIYNF